ncbi:hypothetical protein SALWKB12_0923 [Snodgrassella communis]|jgi:cbb3-type cytochrome oxidase subunit 3|uniref:hypothetical protein n=1 Tax=Snodgrassella communis TaxID=2946699 RepID=UPI000461FB65|nr:hypothetical protein [Snodgrassella communis]KDN13116.1 hypothetical protein SALWKB12_0923 [Snodgrassella communis]
MFSPLFFVYMLITLVGLVVFSLIYKQYKKVMLEYYRMGIFKLRDELFDYAATGNISFDNESYQLVRTLLNGYLRYAENLDIYRFQKFQKAIADKKISTVNLFMQKYNQTSKTLSEEQKEKLDNCLKQSAFIAVTYMIRKSIVYCIGLLIKLLLCNGISKGISRSSWTCFRREKGETINQDLVTDIYKAGAHAS